MKKQQRRQERQPRGHIVHVMALTASFVRNNGARFFTTKCDRGRLSSGLRRLRGDSPPRLVRSQSAASARSGLEQASRLELPWTHARLKTPFVRSRLVRANLSRTRLVPDGGSSRTSLDGSRLDRHEALHASSGAHMQLCLSWAKKNEAALNRQVAPSCGYAP